MLFNKFYSIQKNVSVIFASKLMNFTDFYDKLLKNLYDCNFTLNFRMTYRKNTIILPCQNFTVFLVLASATSKISVYRIYSY